MSEHVKTTCPYCGVGCGIVAKVEDNGEVSVKGDPDHPANFGRLCSKGSALGETLDLNGRLLHPEINTQRASWDDALDLVAQKFSEAIRDHGPESVAFYVSGQLLTEDYYVANKLMKGFIGSANIDTNSRLCMASSVAGHKRAFGADTVPGTYEDLELADLIVLVGSNLAWCHPVLYQRISAAKEMRPEMRVVLIDPRRTMTADLADLHLAIKNDGDVALFLGLINDLKHTNAFDQNYVDAHVNGMAAALQAANGFDIEAVAKQTGLSATDIGTFYSWFAATTKTVTVYSQGVNQSQSGTDKVNAIINCHLATGRIGKPGMGPLSVTGQPNAMGGREVGGLANTLAAHMDIENASHRQIVQDFWQSPLIAQKPGLKAVDMFKAVGDGRIKALWIMSTNPVVSMPDSGAVEAAIKACPFVVVSDVMSQTDTIRHAHVKLPATAWGEKNGTVTNSERRISRQRAFLLTPGEAKPDWWQLAEVGKRMGFGAAFHWASPAEIFGEHAALSGNENDGSRDFDISAYAGITEDAYQGLTPFQWPQAAGQAPQDTRFFANGNYFTPDKKARAVAVDAPELKTHNGLFTLNTGRVRDHWHTMTRTGKSAKLSAHMAEPFCEIHPDDAGELGIGDAGLVTLSNTLGSVILRGMISPRQRKGAVFAPMHWSDQNSANARIDRLVAALTDPVSGQPASKASLVSLTPFVPALYGFAVSISEPQPKDLPYFSMAIANDGWRLEFAFGALPAQLETTLRTMFCVAEDAELLVYHDVASGQQRFAFFKDDKLIGAAFLSRNPVSVSRSSSATDLARVFNNRKQRFCVIATRPGADMPDPGAQICACFNIGTNQIVTAIQAGCTNVEAVGKATSAGTNCGSCKAEIRSILAAISKKEIDDDHRLLAAE